jgi:hypothetical protein
MAWSPVPDSELDFLSLPRWPGEHFTLVLLDRDRWFWDKFVEITSCLVAGGTVGALVWVGRVHCHHVFVYVVTMHVMEMPVV